ncbi:anthranilate synthase component I family protein [Microbacter margulisiae]|uniref:Anthranilate synthase component 1 n=1 Tax=Microbacter margulisiae TaxID=1350067 RepID=A0A7W5DRI4_9PORP|nr:anthranilate synthase component I family protein [Microbacter margulisiae]MBB3187752.1 anthranilate synthase component 1 [Microbacter margulisiae]
MKTKLRTISKKLLADLHTPVSIYLKIRDIYPESVLLESSDYHGSDNSYSFIGLQAAAKFIASDDTVTEQYPNGEILNYAINSYNSLPEQLQRFTNSFEIVDNKNELPFNGFFGYTAYDAVRYFEKVPIQPQKSSTQVPDMYYILYKYILVIDHFKNELFIVENLFNAEQSRMDEVISHLENRNYASYNFAPKGEELCNMSDEHYKETVKQGIQHCKRGDTFQIVISRRFGQPFTGDDFKVYRALRSINPSPYLFYFDFGSFRIFGSSPETHVQVKKGKAYIDPIAGTFRRTGDDEKDLQLAEALLKDPKENAEHVMLVDLARNDLSRNASDVQLDIYKEVQFYSHVIHLVSRVSGKLFPDVHPVRLFADTFPAGTLSGAPKVRAMQLINEIEPDTRGIYGGCIGYIGLNGDINQAITIRTFLSIKNTLYYQAGAGIVAKSDPESELQEVNNKLGALKKAIDLAATLKN